VNCSSWGEGDGTDAQEWLELTRRRFLQDSASGLSGSCSHQPAPGVEIAENAPAPSLVTRHGRNRICQILCPGAASHLDLGDYKPALEQSSRAPAAGAEKEGSLFRLQEWPSDEVTVAALSPPDRAAEADPRSDCRRMRPSTSTISRYPLDDFAVEYSRPGECFCEHRLGARGVPPLVPWVRICLGSRNDNLRQTFVAITDARGEPPNGEAKLGQRFSAHAPSTRR
jgi:hypothetical protein